MAVDDAYSTDEGTALTVAAPGVLGNDTDSDGNPLTAVKVGNPSTAASRSTPTARSPTRPTAGYNGADTFTYWASDGTSISNLATVNLTVVAPPGVARSRTSTPGPRTSFATTSSRWATPSTSCPATTVPAAGLWRTDGTEAAPCW